MGQVQRPMLSLSPLTPVPRKRHHRSATIGPMSLQRRLAQAMLALLGLAALAGVGTIFLPGGDFVARVAATLAVAAIAIGAAMPVSRRLDRQETRSSGVFGLGAVIVGFCLALLAIWSEFLRWPDGLRLALTTLAYVACAVPAAVFFALLRREAGRTAGGFGLVVTATTFVLWLAAIWGGRYGLDEDKLAQTAAIVGGAGVLVPACLVGRRGDRCWWRWFGVAAGAVMLTLGLGGIWVSSNSDATWFAQSLIVLVTIAAVNLLVRAPFRGAHRWLVLATAAALVATGASATAANLTTRGFQYSSADTISQRLFGAGAIVTVCGLLALVVIHAFSRRVLITRSARIEDIERVDLACPRCARRQQAPIGESRCPGCGLIFLLRVAEPRCAKCDYPLLDLRSAACPECGEAIPTTRSQAETSLVGAPARP